MDVPQCPAFNSSILEFGKKALNDGRFSSVIYGLFVPLTTNVGPSHVGCSGLCPSRPTGTRYSHGNAPNAGIKSSMRSRGSANLGLLSATPLVLALGVWAERGGRTKLVSRNCRIERSYIRSQCKIRRFDKRRTGSYCANSRSASARVRMTPGAKLLISCIAEMYVTNSGRSGLFVGAMSDMIRLERRVGLESASVIATFPPLFKFKLVRKEKRRSKEVVT